MELRRHIREIPDFPQPCILFRDVTPLLKSTVALQHVIDSLTKHYTDHTIAVVIGIETCGFLFAAPLALSLGKLFIPVRKKDKLPFETHIVKYAKEYGNDGVELHTDAIAHGQRVLIVDDLLATCGTLDAGNKLVETIGGQVIGLAVMIELTDLRGHDHLSGYDVFSLVQY